jgi:hypothetical protein
MSSVFSILCGTTFSSIFHFFKKQYQCLQELTKHYSNATVEDQYRRFVSDGIGTGSIWNSVRAQSVLGEGDFIESLSEYLRGRKQIPELAKSQRFMNKPPLRDIFKSEVLRDKRKRDKSIGEAVFEHGYAQREVADHLRIHFTSVSRILRAKDEMLIK